MKPGMDAGTEHLVESIKNPEYFNPNTKKPEECDREIERLQALIDASNRSGNPGEAREYEAEREKVKAIKDRIAVKQKQEAK